jgi:hypothetical protein
VDAVLHYLPGKDRAGAAVRAVGGRILWRRSLDEGPPSFFGAAPVAAEVRRYNCQMNIAPALPNYSGIPGMVFPHDPPVRRMTVDSSLRR